MNFVEGDVSVGNIPARPGVVVGANQLLTTGNGRAEMLLTPGVILRAAQNSSVRMTSPDLANTRVSVDKGRAIVEVVRIVKENDIRVEQNGASTRILKNGLYEFDADHSQVRVFKGKADVTAANRKVSLGENRQVTLGAGGKLEAHSFEPRQYEDDFYRWGALRSGYLSEASINAASRYIGTGPGWYGPGWVGLGWYWDPFFGVYTFLPDDGIFWGPFGWGFYSPIAAFYSPFHFYYRGYGVPHAFSEFHGPYGHGFAEGGLGRPGTVSGFGGRGGGGGRR